MRLTALLFVFPFVLLIASAACADDVSYAQLTARLHDGDLIFQESRSAQSVAVRAATGSRYSHMGVIFGIATGRPVVLEAVQPVRETPLRAWIERGQSHHFVVKRLAAGLDANAAERVRREARRFLGRGYDTLFDWSDARIYCSELAWKAYERALSVRIGEPQPWRDLDLDEGVVTRLATKRLGRLPTPDALVITPVRMMDSPLLVEVA